MEAISFPSVCVRAPSVPVRVTNPLGNARLQEGDGALKRSLPDEYMKLGLVEGGIQTGYAENPQGCGLRIADGTLKLTHA